MRAAGLQRPEGGQAAAGGVEQRHRVDAHVARRRRPDLGDIAARCSIRPRWCSRAPLGKPVVPDVYWIWAGSSAGRHGGQRRRSPPEPGTRRSREGRRRRAGRAARRGRSSTTRAIGLPAVTRADEDIPTALDWCSTYASSRGLVGRVDRHQGQAGQRRAELDDHPLRDVGRPDGDALAGAEALRAARGRTARRGSAARRRSTSGGARRRREPPGRSAAPNARPRAVEHRRSWIRSSGRCWVPPGTTSRAIVVRSS